MQYSLLVEIGENVTSLVVLAMCAGVCAIFAACEAAFFSLARWQVRKLRESEGWRGRLVADLLTRPDELSAVIGFGNAMGVAGIVYVVFWLGHRTGNFLEWSLGGVGLLLACEIAPKLVGLRVSDRLALLAAPALYAVKNVTRPLRSLARQISSFLVRRLRLDNPAPAAGLTLQDYQELIEFGFRHGALARSGRDMIVGIVALARKQVREIMRPRVQMPVISDEADVEEMVAMARKLKMRRIPLYDRHSDTIVGLLNTRALLLNPDVELSEAIEPPSFVPETMSVLKLLRSFQRQHRDFAIVLDEFGDMAGYVTLEDILNEAMGPVMTDRLLCERVGKGKWRVSGILRVDDFKFEYPEMPSVRGVETMGGVMMALLGEVPKPGQSVVFHKLKLTALKVNDRSVKEILVEVLG